MPKQREDGEGREKTAVGSVLFRMSNNQGKGVNEQELVYEKGYQLLFGDKTSIYVKG